MSTRQNAQRSGRTPHKWGTLAIAVSAVAIGGIGYQATHSGAAGTTGASSTTFTQTTAVQATSQPVAATTGGS